MKIILSCYYNLFSFNSFKFIPSFKLYIGERKDTYHLSMASARVYEVLIHESGDSALIFD